MLMRVWFDKVESVSWIRLEMTLRIRLLTLDGAELKLMSSVPGEHSRGLVRFGVQRLRTCIVSFSRLLGLLYMRMGGAVPIRSLWFGALELGLSDGGLLKLCGTLLCCLGPGRVGWAICISAGDVGRWPYSVGAPVKLTSFLSSLHSPTEVSDLGNGGDFLRRGPYFV